jgi:hypothetical protein
MSAYIVEGAENGVLSEDKENGIARGMVKQLVRTRLRELARVCQRYGCLRSGQRDQYHNWEGSDLAKDGSAIEGEMIV